MDICEINSLIVLHPPPHPYCGGVSPLWRPDPFSLEILHGLDAAVLVDVERTETEQPRANDGQPHDVWVFSSDLRAELCKRELRDIELSVRRESGETLMMGEYEPIEIDPFGVHVPDPDVAEVIVVVGCDR